MLVLCVWVLVSLAAETFLPLAEETRQILQYADTGICVRVENELDDVRAELRAIRALLEQRSTAEQRRA